MTKKVFAMKNIFSSTKRVFSLMIMMLVASMMVTLVGCSDDNGGTETPSNDKYSNIPEEELISFEGYAGIIGTREGMIDNAFLTVEDGDITNVWIDGSSRFIYLPKIHPQYDQFYSMLLQKNRQSSLLKITIHDKEDDHGYPIINVETLTTVKEKELLERYESQKEEAEENISKRSIPQTISYTEASRFFRKVANMSCDRLRYNPCIPFQYAADGCYSRAHAMRKKFKSEFGFDCNKVFTYGSLRAQTQAGCTQRWRYHVAPLVYVDVGNQTAMYVIDPGLFTRPVTITTWINKQKGRVNRYEIKNGNIYMPNYQTGGYYTDASYNHTNQTNESYSSLYGCRGLV